jgi:hypothetical protein
MMLVLSAAVNGTALALILWQAKQVRLQNYYQPATGPASAPGLPYGACLPSPPISSSVTRTTRN